MFIGLFKLLKSERSKRSLSIPEVSRVITVVRDVNVFRLLKKRSFRCENDDDKSKTNDRFLEVSFLIVFIQLVVSSKIVNDDPSLKIVNEDRRREETNLEDIGTYY